MNSIVHVQYFDVGYKIPKKEVQPLKLPTIKCLESSELSNRVPFKDFQQYLKKKLGKGKHQSFEFPQIQSNNLSPNELQMRLQKNITIRQVNEQKELEQYKLKIILNEKMQNKLKSFAQSGLNNIPVNEKLLEKAIFKYKQKDRRNLSNIIQNTLVSQDLNQESVIYYCKQHGVKGIDVDKILYKKSHSRKPSLSYINMDADHSQIGSQSGIRVSRAKSHNYFIMKQSLSSVKKRKQVCDISTQLNKVPSQLIFEPKIYLEDKKYKQRKGFQDLILQQSLEMM